MGDNHDVSESRRDEPRANPAFGPDRRYSAGASEEHPGMANYPSDGDGYRRSDATRRSNPTPSSNRYLPPLGEQRTENLGPPSGSRSADERVTRGRGAAMRSREMGTKVYSMVH